MSAWELKTARNTRRQYETTQDKQRRAAVYVAGAHLRGAVPDRDALVEVLEMLGLKNATES